MGQTRKQLPVEQNVAGRHLAEKIRHWGHSLGFDAIAITDTELADAEQHLERWLAAGFHGSMDYMKRHGRRRSRPSQLVPGTIRIISARMNYLAEPLAAAGRVLASKDLAYLSRYALGRDYHKLIRHRLQRLAETIRSEISALHFRAFVDSAPVLEKALAEKAGLGWIGKHSNLIDKTGGSFFFLGELYTNLPLPVDKPVQNHCGSCRKCISVCPTQAIVAPYRLDARRCISYLTIELHGPIPTDLRKQIGNRVFGCDDCQLVCPWNKYARITDIDAFHARHGLEAAQLIDLLQWDEETFRRRTEGSPIRRIGYEGWLRNLAVAVGNGSPSTAARAALTVYMSHPSAMVREHVCWAMGQLSDRITAGEKNVPGKTAVHQ